MPEFDKRPWGEFRVVCKEENYLIKELKVKPGGRTSLQYHNFRSEYWIVLRGKGKIVKGSKVIDVKEGDFIKIEKREIHRIENPYNEDLIILEVWVGEKLDEKDIVRVRDDYGRV